jgi:hypothetical protein
MGYSILLVKFVNGDGAALDTKAILDRLRPQAACVYSDGALELDSDPTGHATVRVNSDSIEFDRPSVGTRDLIYSLAEEFDLVIVPLDAPVKLIREAQRAHLPSQLGGDAIVVHSGVDVLSPIY